ncbi:MAG: hypothetical protein ACRD00_02280 [Thermoanaerobaculia bacterium]
MKKLIATSLAAFLFFMVAHTGSAACKVCTTSTDSCITADASNGCKINIYGHCQATDVRCGQGEDGGDVPEFQGASGLEVDPWAFWA